jgi:hypothetical protein
MDHSPAPESPPSPAGVGRLVAQVLCWFVPGVLLAVVGILIHGTGRIAEHTTPEPATAGPATARGETQIRAALEDRITVDLHDVTDLVPIGNGTLSGRDLLSALISLIESSVGPDTWETVGGPGTITPLNFENSRMLSIWQTQQAHEDVGNFLAVLRRARHNERETVARPILAADGSPAAQADARIRRMLDKPIRCDYSRQRLDDALSDLGRRLGIFIWLDNQNILDHGIAVDQPVTVHLRTVSGREALKAILDPANLMWVIEDGMLKITGPGCERYFARVYDVADLVAPARSADGSTRYDAEPLARAIKTLVRPEEWNIGYSEIHEFHAERIHVLVILQTTSAHEEIAEYLETLRTARRKAVAPARRGS